MKKIFWIPLAILFTQCTVVQPWERGFLSDPLMDEGAENTKLSLEEKFFSTQEGSAGSTDGMSGGCGCAK